MKWERVGTEMITDGNSPEHSKDPASEGKDRGASPTPVKNIDEEPPKRHTPLKIEKTILD